MDRRPLLRVRGDELVDQEGRPVRLRGVGLGGWLCMENFITGYPGTETLMRRALARALGRRRAAAFFDRLLTAFFAEPDAALLRRLGVNCVRLPVNWRHLRPGAGTDGYAHLDRVIDLCARHRIYTVIDLHALPGAQNHYWHSDNPTHLPAFWDHPALAEQVLDLWHEIATRYRDQPWVAGYNPINEPADEAGRDLPRLYRALIARIRAADPDHILFLDGNRYATDFTALDLSTPNTVPTCHDYAVAGLADGDPDGPLAAPAELERAFLRRTTLQRESGTPIWVGEFGPVYPDDNPSRHQILTDQLALYRRHNASWSLWTYKDIGLQGLVYAHPEGPYRRLLAPHLAHKRRLGVDSWGPADPTARAITEPLAQLLTREFPDYNPYPFGARDRVDHLVRHILLAEPLLDEYTATLATLEDADLAALADSFKLENCVVREPLATTLSEATADL